MNISEKTMAAHIISVMEGTGTKSPKAIIAAYKDAQRVTTAARQLYPTGDSLGAAVAAALIERRDPITDPAVVRILTGAQIGIEGIALTVEAIAFDRFRAVCLEHVDALVLAWRKPFNAAVATLTACLDRIGPVPLEDTDSIMGRGGDIADVWADALAAARIVDIIAGGWGALVEFTRTVPNDLNYRLLRLADVDPETWQAKGLRRQKLTPWSMLLAGLTPALPTPREYRQRVDRIVTAESQPEPVEKDPTFADYTVKIKGIRTAESLVASAVSADAAQR